MPASKTVHIGDHVSTIRQSGRVVRGRVMAIELGEARICDGDSEFWAPVDCCRKMKNPSNICLLCGIECKYKGA